VKLLRSLDDLPAELRSGAVSVGNFDGVHLGHVQIIQRLVAAARRVGGAAVVFTFDPHPARLLRPDRCPTPLATIERRAELLAELGVDALIAYPTDNALLVLTARQFFDLILRERLAARAIVEGTNFCFGRDRQGTIDTLRQYAAETGVGVEVVEAVMAGGEAISSSRVRGLITAGDVAAARQLLTEAYRVQGLVSRGAGRGGQIGFPTANLEDIATLLPAHGVYAGTAYVAGQRWPAAINVGPNPTFGEMAAKVEVHLIGFTGALYGQTVEVDFLDRLRDTHTFRGIEELKMQISRDVEAVRRIAAR
jgi:riboflavin kinase/FMN adenylyltransferase